MPPSAKLRCAPAPRPSRLPASAPPDANVIPVATMPSWLPDAARLYLKHTELGVSLRALARERGCHASTVMRQVRRYENRRDDPLMDEALNAMGRVTGISDNRMSAIMGTQMKSTTEPDPAPIDETAICAEAPRILRRLAEQGAVLVIAADMEKAAVLRTGVGGQMVQTAVLNRTIAQAFALKDWITCQKAGRIATYVLSSTGRIALRNLGGSGTANRDAADDTAALDDAGRRPRHVAAESPVAVLARRRDPDGSAFLNNDLVAAAERLREDFELAQMGPRVTQNWERFLTGPNHSTTAADPGMSRGSQSARDRVAAALGDLGPGLGDVALRCCCFLEGLETAERHLGWAARSGKIVLRIALQRLRRHYDVTYGRSGPLIG